jgi:hypothetical protein
MGMDKIKTVNDRLGYESAVNIVLKLDPDSEKDSVDEAVGKMVVAIVGAGLTPSQKLEIFAKMDERCTELSIGKLTAKNKRTTYMASEIRDAALRLKRYLNPLLTRKPSYNLIAKYYRKTPDTKTF